MPPRTARRRVNGDGSLTRRADGRWMGRYYAWTSAGTRKRITVYGQTRQEAADRMREAQERNRQGIPVPDRAWKLADWLDYWLENVIAANRRPATHRLYEMTVRLYLKPQLGRYSLTRLSASRVQAFLNEQLSAGRSVRQVQVMKTVLSSALTRAMREELVMRNVARLAELPAWERQPITPWTAAEARGFLDAARGDPLYPAFVLLLLYGLRRGEVLGLRWRDVDQADDEIRIRQQVQRLKGRLWIGPVKTAAGRRDLPLLQLATDVLEIRRDAQAADREELGRAWQDNGLVFTTRTGRPIEPRNLVRSFKRICDAHELRAIKVHHLRHTTATLLKNLRVPARDAQLILGHSRLAVTLEIYSHEDKQAHRDALGKISDVLGGGPAE
ncbi:MAG TPA: tyrosine-type recombinase/integrase [Streptosporangiaceae bacterium]